MSGWKLGSFFVLFCFLFFLMFLTISYHKFIIVACSMRFNVQGEDVELHSGTRSLEKPRAVRVIAVAFRPARGEKKEWRLARPQEPSASTWREERQHLSNTADEKKVALSLPRQSCAKVKQPIKSSFSKKSINILLDPLIQTAVINNLLFAKKNTLYSTFSP